MYTITHRSVKVALRQIYVLTKFYTWHNYEEVVMKAIKANRFNSASNVQFAEIKTGLFNANYYDMNLVTILQYFHNNSSAVWQNS